MFAYFTVAQKVTDFFEHPFQSFYRQIKGTQPGTAHHGFEGFRSINHNRGSVQ
jgi:hypothetical protein